MLGRTQKKVEHGSKGKRSGGWEKANKKRRNGESTYMDGM